jgi:hypothetical protein
MNELYRGLEKGECDFKEFQVKEKALIESRNHKYINQITRVRTLLYGVVHRNIQIESIRGRWLAEKEWCENRITELENKCKLPLDVDIELRKRAFVQAHQREPGNLELIRLLQEVCRKQEIKDRTTRRKAEKQEILQRIKRYKNAIQRDEYKLKSYTDV